MSSPMRTISRNIRRVQGNRGAKRVRKEADRIQMKIDREMAAKAAQKAAKRTEKKPGIFARIRNALRKKEA